MAENSAANSGGMQIMERLGAKSHVLPYCRFKHNNLTQHREAERNSCVSCKERYNREVPK